ncbi:MAG: HEAT repeat domain-containing protein, partial [Planctomycetota bacterium]
AQRGINYICSAQQAGGGWDYRGTRFRTNRNDLSIAGWAIMAMKSALVADVKVPRRHWDRAKRFVRQSQRSDGEYRYADRGFQGFGGEVRHGPGMTAVGLLCDLYLGSEPGSGELALAARRVAGETPDWNRLMTEELHSVYYWYYGTLAMFQWGGEHWHTWNAAMRPTLLKNQRRGGHADGSWDPDGVWLGKYGGRLYSTTFNILNLEIYYRYLPIYRNLGRAPEADPQDIADAGDALKKASSKSAGVRFAALNKLRDEKGEDAFAALKKGLQDKNQMVRYTTIKALQKREEPEATALLLEAFATEARDLRRVIVDALGKRGDRGAVPALIGALSDADPEVRRRAPRALERLTQERFGADPRAWRRWWEAERRK